MSAVVENGSTTISETTFTFTVLHRTDEPIESLAEAIARSIDGHAVGQEDWGTTVPVKDEDVAERLVALNNDGTFFDYDLGLEDED